MILGILFGGLWEGAAIVALAYVIARTLSRDATTRYAIWFAALVALAVAPVLTRLSNTGSRLLAAVQPHAAPAKWTITLLPAPMHELGGFWNQAAPWIILAWSLGAGVGILRLITSMTRIARIRKEATRLSAARDDVLVSSSVTIPVAIGLLAPAIVLPKALVDALTPADVERVIAHEQAHLRRHDVAGNFVQRLVEAVLFFNPWVHLVGSALLLEREAACDDWAIAKMGSADEYAALLASLAVRVRQPRAPLTTPSALGSRHAVVSRIRRLGGGARRSLTLNYYVVGGTVMLFAILLLALEAFSPAMAFAPAQTITSTPATASIASTCAKPNVDATVTSPAMPKMPHGLTVKGTATVLVTIAPNGSVKSASVSKTSGNAAIDNAVLDAARQSKYSPKLVNCQPVQGTYLFLAAFKPEGQ